LNEVDKDGIEKEVTKREKFDKIAQINLAQLYDWK
jgi:hypothetical protein